MNDSMNGPPGSNHNKPEHLAQVTSRTNFLPFISSRNYIADRLLNILERFVSSFCPESQVTTFEVQVSTKGLLIRVSRRSW